MKLLYIVLPILSSICSIILILGPHLYSLTKNIFYLYLTILSTVVLIYLIYTLYVYDFSTIVITIFGKIIPTIALTLISLYITKDSIPTPKKLAGLVIVVIGMFMLV
jgi:hypothetical protein